MSETTASPPPSLTPGFSDRPTDASPPPGLPQSGPRHQVLLGVAAATILSVTVAATALLVADAASSGGAQDAASTERMVYERRLQALAEERDAEREAALAAQERYDAALGALSAYQDQLFEAEQRLVELSESRAALSRILAQTMQDRDAAAAELAQVAEAEATADLAALTRAHDEAAATVDFLATALDRAAADRNAKTSAAADALSQAESLERELARVAAENERIFSRLEDAVTLAMEPLGTMFEAVGLPPAQLLDQMRRQYSGEGGPLTPIAFSTKGREPTLAEARADAILADMDALNLYRIAADKVPFATPVSGGVRMTSAFGYRRDPFHGGKRFHAGIDWAGPHGAPIRASAEGVVSFAGWQSGYGRIVKIRHAFGIETRFAHLAEIKVREGQRVSRGDLIGGMGNSGRSTGTHLHYEVRVGGDAVDPMTYIKAARHVF